MVDKKGFADGTATNIDNATEKPRYTALRNDEGKFDVLSVEYGPDGSSSKVTLESTHETSTQANDHIRRLNALEGAKGKHARVAGAPAPKSKAAKAPTKRARRK